MKPVSFQEFVDIVGGVVKGVSLDDEFTGVSIDSRTLKPNDLFWAVSGDRCDGSMFSDKAMQNGAIAVVVSQEYEKCVSGPKVIVKDSLIALHEFAKWYREQFELTVIGVTGSCGKTTTREMIYSVLSQKYSGIQSQKNYNNELGVPLTLLEIEDYHQFVVVEMGASAVGDIELLSKIASPQMGVITSIAPSHLEKFESIENIVNTKREMFLKLPEEGRAFVSLDESYYAELIQNISCPAISVGRNSGSDFYFEILASDNDQIRFKVNQEEYCLPMAGKHFVNAAIFALAIGKEFNLTSNEIKNGLEKVKYVPGRCHVQDVNGLTLIDDSYNSNPASLKAACLLLSEWETEGRKIIVTGDMLEIGELSSNYHKEAGCNIAKSNIDLVIACGKNAHDLIDGAVSKGMTRNKLFLFDSANIELIDYLKSIVIEDDVVLVKGSRGMEMDRIVKSLSDVFQENRDFPEPAEKVCV